MGVGGGGIGGRGDGRRLDRVFDDRCDAAGLREGARSRHVRAAQMRPATVPADYLLAHQEYSPANALQGVGPYLRDVAATSAAAARGRRVTRVPLT